MKKQIMKKQIINILEKVGEFNLKGRCLGVMYEPKIPKELKKLK
ncbi:cyclic lactone autoinducer peptide [Bacillus manliponensis]